METRRLRLVVAAVVLLGAGGFAGFLLTADSREATIPAPDVESVPITAEELAQAADVRLFFGHMSVGENILAGSSALYAANGVTQPPVIEFAVGGPLPQVPASGAVVHAPIGENSDPLGKLRNFDAVLRSGLAEQVDVALLKFCYVDFTYSTDVDALFREYRTTLDALERDFPDVTFLHSTAPLMVEPSGLKDNFRAMLGRDDNVARERYSALVRQAYEADRIFDIAAIEGTAPDGSRKPALYAGYSTDGGHLNEAASALVAAELLKLVAAAGQP